MMLTAELLLLLLLLVVVVQQQQQQVGWWGRLLLALGLGSCLQLRHTACSLLALLLRRHCV
jgi:hypothetical protein